MTAEGPGGGWAAVVAFVAVALCCLVPVLLLTGGVSLFAGAVRQHPWAVAIGGAMLVLGAVGVAVRSRSRRG